MVERGQVLERMTLVRAADSELHLEALFQAGAGDARGVPVVLAAPHPRLGGSMDSAVLAEIVWGLARQGHATLRFNWRGVSASQGEIDADVAVAAADLSAAVDQHLASTGGRACAVIGYSFGALVAARVAVSHPAVERVVLIAPPVDAFGDPGADLAALVGSGVPSLIFCGAEDTFSPPTRVVAVAAGVPVHTVARAGHSFGAGLAELGRRVVEVIPAPGDGLDENDGEGGGDDPFGRREVDAKPSRTRARR